MKNRCTIIICLGVSILWFAGGLRAATLPSLDDPAVEATQEDTDSSGMESAQSSEEENKQRAKDFFKTGSSLFAEERYLEAAAAFEQAYAIEPHGAVLANIALCYDRGGSVLKAIDAYRRYLETPLENTPNAEMRDRLKELENQTGEVDVACLSEGCEVFVDEQGKQTDAGVFVLLPGIYWIEGRTEDQVVDHQKVIVKAGARIQVRLRPAVSVTPEPEIEAPPDPVPVKPVSTLAFVRTPFWITAGVAVAAGITAGAFGVAALSKHEDFVDGGRTDVDIQSSGENCKLVTNIALGVSGAAAAGAVVLLIQNLRQRNKEHGSVQVTTGPGLGVGIHAAF